MKIEKSRRLEIIEKVVRSMIFEDVTSLCEAIVGTDYWMIESQLGASQPNQISPEKWREYLRKLLIKVARI